MPGAYYNDNEPFVAEWLRNAIAAGVIADGDVDERKIEEVQPDDIRGYTQVHLFAGVGGWPYAFRLAGWDDVRPVWSASCPCPPFSTAGKKTRCPECKGESLVWCPRRTGYAICADCEHAWFADARHLWPEVWRLSAQCRPELLVGEQVVEAIGAPWFSAVRASMEILGYVVGARRLPAASVGAPHKRHRRFWLALPNERRQSTPDLPVRWWGQDQTAALERGVGVGVADAVSEGRQQESGSTLGDEGKDGREPHGDHQSSGPGKGIGTVADADGAKWRPVDQARGGEGRDVVPQRNEGADGPGGGSKALGLGNTAVRGVGPHDREPSESGEPEGKTGGSGSGLGDTGRKGWQERVGDAGVQREEGRRVEGEAAELSGDVDPDRGLRLDAWDGLVLIPCFDGRWRLVPPPESDIFAVAPGLPLGVGSLSSGLRGLAEMADLDGASLKRAKAFRIGVLRAYGNSIVPQLAAVFIRSFMEEMGLT